MTHLRIILVSGRLGQHKGWKALRVLEQWAHLKGLSYPLLSRLERLKFLFNMYKASDTQFRNNLWIAYETRALRHPKSAYRIMLKSYGFKDPRKKRQLKFVSYAGHLGSSLSTPQASVDIENTPGPSGAPPSLGIADMINTLPPGFMAWTLNGAVLGYIDPHGNTHSDPSLAYYTLTGQLMDFNTQMADFIESDEHA